MKVIYLFRFFVFLFLVSTHLSCTPRAGVANGDGVGNGGGKMRTLFDNAQQKAVEYLSRINYCSIPGTNMPSDLLWLVKNTKALAEDIKGTKLEIQDDPIQADCASTEKKPRGKIILSYKKCAKENYSLDDAVRLMIHESVHHINTSETKDDEKFAESVARIAINAEENHKDVCDAWPEFDSNSCQGEPLTHKDLETLQKKVPQENVIGEYNTIIRSRACPYDDNCEGLWRQYDKEEYVFYNRFKREIRVVSYGKVTFNKIGNSNDYAISTVGAGTLCKIGDSHCKLMWGPRSKDEFYFPEGSMEPLVLHQTLNKNCLRQEGFFSDFREGFRREYQIVILSRF